MAGRFLDERLSAGLELRYVGDRPRRDGSSEDSYLTVGGRLRYSPLGTDRLLLIGDVRNLFDTEYGHVVGDDHVQQSLQMDGITSRLGMRLRF